MSVNGITSGSVTDNYAAYTATAKKNDTDTTKTVQDEVSAVYEPTTSSTEATSTTAKTYTSNTALVAQLKSDAEANSLQLANIVKQLLTGQGNAFGQAKDMWQFLASGNYTVDADTKAQAQADIAEDGYWGVSQTSSRILDFATALTGGDPDKIEEMRSAFQQGYEDAKKTWGGELPEISQKTYDAVMSGFDKLAEEAGLTS